MSVPPAPEAPRILQFHYVDRSDRRFVVLWPAWAYRVTAPVIERRVLDLFQQVILALCQSGVRHADQIGQRIGLDTRLCGHILNEAKRAGHLDARGELTEEGREALRIGATTEDPRWQVCYVFQDPFTEQLWPRAVDQLSAAYVLGFEGDRVQIQLATAGRSDVAWGHQVCFPEKPPRRPTAADVLGALMDDRSDRRTYAVREFEQNEGLEPVTVPDDFLRPQPPGRVGADQSEIHRISLIAEPEAVLLIGFVEVTGQDAFSPRTEGWTAHDLFGVADGEWFRSLIHRYLPHDHPIAKSVEERVQAETERFWDEYRKVDHTARERAENDLVQVLGPEIRERHDVYELMMDVELAVRRGDQAEAIEKAAHHTWRLYEALARRMASAYPIPPEISDLNNRLRRAALEKATQDLGFHTLPGKYAEFGADTVRNVARDAQRGRGYVQPLMVSCLLAAASSAHPDHPLRRMAAHRPDLLTSLLTLNAIRNGGAHAEPSEGAPGDGPWCRALAIEAARELLLLSPPN
ncbi:hypothetical protein ABZ912_48125 [Nonomuraea angiospora]|uniref:hypothetical protein n=1 Tax=Nonomuraea angiospora TaxID=46172 RepID=UPI0033DE7342